MPGCGLQLTTTTRDEESRELSCAGDLISTVLDMIVVVYMGRCSCLWRRRDLDRSSLDLVGAGCWYSVTDDRRVGQGTTPAGTDT
jgi:hypothetical protein